MTLWMPKFAYPWFKRFCWRYVYAATFHGHFARVVVRAPEAEADA
jgi:hypothetical protein